MALDADELIAIQERFESDRTYYESNWQDAADYGMPNQNQITRKDSPGATRPDLYDTTAEDSNIQLAAGLYSYLFPTDTTKAFVIQIDDSRLNDIDEVKQWCDKVTTVLHYHLIQSNFRQAFFEFLKSMSCYGPGCLYEEKGLNTPIVFQCHHISGVYFDLNFDGIADTVSIERNITARQAVQKFKDNLDTVGELVRQAAESSKTWNKKFEFIHFVMPRTEYERKSDGTHKDDPLNMPIASIWVNRTEKCKVSEDGFPEMPYQISNFDRDPNEVYGRSPMVKCLPDIRMVNHLQKALIKGSEKQVDPPVILPDDGSIWPLATQPGGVIYKRVGSDSPEWFKFEGDLTTLEKAILRTQQKIQKGFFLDMFDPLVDRQNMTATEVMARIEQKIRFLTPIIGRLQSDLFNPMIHRMMGILGRQTDEKTGQSLLPPIPEVLAGKNYHVMYLGRLALAMKTLETEGLVKTLTQWSPLFEANDLSPLDNLDKDIAFRDSLRNNGTPATWIKNTEERDAIRQAQAEAQAQKEMVEQAKTASNAARNLSKQVEEGSPLEMIANAE